MRTAGTASSGRCRSSTRRRDGSSNGATAADPFGTGHYELDYHEKLRSVALVETVRDAVGDEVEILIEMHGRFSPATAIEIAAMADAQYVTVAPHNVGGPVSTATGLHLAACTTNFKIQEHFNDFQELWVKEAATDGGYPEVVEGYFPIPEGPGLGVTLNEDLVREHPFEQGSFNLWTDDWHKREF